MANDALTQKEFYSKAMKPKIPSFNTGDEEPEQTRGITQEAGLKL